MHMRDSEVVASIVAGDPDGLATAYDRYADPLYQYCRSMLSDPAAAADAVQDTFVIAASRLDRLRDPDKFEAWLQAMADHECLRIQRSPKGTSPLAAAAGEAEAAVDGAPAGLKAHTLALASGHGPAAAAHRAAVLSRVGKLTRDGFPKAGAKHGSVTAGTRRGSAKAGLDTGRHARGVRRRGALQTPRGQAVTAVAMLLALVAITVTAFELTGNSAPANTVAAVKSSAGVTPPAVTLTSQPSTVTHTTAAAASATATATPTLSGTGSAPTSTVPTGAPTGTGTTPTTTPTHTSPTPGPTTTPGSLRQYPPGGTLSHPALLAVWPGGDGTAIHLTASGTGGNWAVSWSVSVAGDPDRVIGVSPSSGSLTPANASATVTITASKYLRCGRHGPSCPTITISPSGAVFTVWTGFGGPFHATGLRYS
jgi:DNA-directed RNA polymerase specialized sigma24 family protein